MTGRFLALLVVVGLMGSGARAAGHHSYNDFDLETTVSLEGVIEKVLFGNPHVVFAIRTKDHGVFTVTWNSASQLARQGVRPELFQVGDTIAVTGNPSRAAAEVSRIREVRRVGTGWSWRMDTGRVSVADER